MWKCKDWGVCCRGCQCPRFQIAIKEYHFFFPGALPPPHLRGKAKDVLFNETKLVEDPTSPDLGIFERWMPLDPTLSIPRAQPRWNP
ncbi:hypothetical protein J6590_055644 [Homalodisca vitripennis]|nr:hypothetical protein J6590_055644 [Homalodisca vitripennis]